MMDDNKKVKNDYTPRRNRIRLSPGDKVWVIIAHIVVILLAFICFYPMWYLFINSIATADAARGAGVLVFPRPGQFYFGTYRQIMSEGRILGGMRVSGARVVVSCILVVTTTSLFSYLTTREQLPFRRIIYRFGIVSMYVSGGLIPMVVLYRTIGLTNNFATYIVPGMFNVGSVILIRAFMQSAIPAELEESAKIDGAGHLTICFKIFVPLSKPILATVALFTAVGAWNAWFDNFLFVTDPRLQTIQRELLAFLQQADTIIRTIQRNAMAGTMSPDMMENITRNLTGDSIRNASTIIAMVPIMMVFPFLQKYFARGIMMGAVKG